MRSSVINYLGPRGSYSYEVALNYIKEKHILPFELQAFSTIAKMFEMKDYEPNSLIIVPLENSTSGDVYETYKHLYNTQFRIVACQTLEIKNSLIAIEGATIDDIEKIYSHPQALMQVSTFLENNNIIGMPYYSTAESVNFISEQNDKSLAAIASRQNAEYFSNTVVIDSKVNNNEANYTRFLVLSLEKNSSPYQICIDDDLTNGSNLFLLFELAADGAGQLSNLLSLLSAYNINLNNIKSRPIEGEKFNYFFIAEADISNITEREMHNQLATELKRFTKKYAYNVYSK